MIHWDMPHLLQDQQFGLRERVQASLQPIFLDILLDQVYQVSHREKDDTDPLHDRGYRQQLTARCVFPTPGGPSSKMFSPFATKRAVASSRICASLRAG